MADPTVTVFQLVNGSGQSLPLSQAVDLIRAHPDLYTIRPPSTTSGAAFVAAALLNLYQDAVNDPTSTSADLLDAILSDFNTRDLDNRSVIASTDSFGGDFVRVAGKTAAGDGQNTLYVKVLSNPGTDSAIQDRSGQWWDLGAPSEFEIIDFEYFCRKYNDHATRLSYAFQALFNDVTLKPARLNCQGIETKLSQPFLLRHKDTLIPGGLNVLSFGAGHLRVAKMVRDLNVTRVVGSYAWQTRDYLFSIAGQQGLSGGNIRSLIFDHPTFDLQNGDQVACHVSGYYHIAFLSPYILGVSGSGPNAIGILSSRYAINTGVGDPGGGIDNSNHGMEILNGDFVGFSGSDAGTAIYSEDGDFNVRTALIDFFGTGIYTARGGINSYGVHFSMSDSSTGRMKPAWKIDAPRSVFIEGDECDGSYITMDTPSANLFSPGTPVGQSISTGLAIGLSSIKISGIKWGSTTYPERHGSALFSGVFDTLGAGWSGSAGTYTHTPGSTADISSAISLPAVGNKVLVEFTISGRTAGTVTFKLTGGTTSGTTTYTATGKKVIRILTGNNRIAVTPTTDFDGSISATTTYEAKGFINFNSQTANQWITGLIIRPDQNVITGTGNLINLVHFSQSGAGSWDGSQFGRVLLEMPDGGVATDVGPFPTGVKTSITVSGAGQLYWDTEAGRLEFLNAAAADANAPYLRPDSTQALIWGRLVAGVQTDFFKMSPSGQFIEQSGASILRSTADSLTAQAGGGRVNPADVVAAYNRYTTVASAADSATLPAAIAGDARLINNTTATAMQVFATGSNTINGVAGVTGVSHAGTTIKMYRCYTTGAWLSDT